MKVMLADDHPLFLEGLQNLLETHGIEIVGTAANGQQAIEKARALKPDVILMDIEMPVLSGLDAIRPIKKELPQTKIVMLTSFDDDENLFEAIKSGASGYLTKNLNAKELFAMIDTMRQGEPPLSPGMAARLMDEFACRANEKQTETAQDKAMGALTERQNEVLDLVSQGMTYKEVGAALGLTERTVKYHMEKILDQLHLENRAQAIGVMWQEKVKEDVK